jgi:hypothetical protein
VRTPGNNQNFRRITSSKGCCQKTCCFPLCSVEILTPISCFYIYNSIYKKSNRHINPEKKKKNKLCPTQIRLPSKITLNPHTWTKWILPILVWQTISLLYEHRLKKTLKRQLLSSPQRQKIKSRNHPINTVTYITKWNTQTIRTRIQSKERERERDRNQLNSHWPAMSATVAAMASHSLQKKWTAGVVCQKERGFQGKPSDFFLIHVAFVQLKMGETGA